MVKGPNLKSNELPRLNLPKILHKQSLTGGANLAQTRVRTRETLTRGVRMSARVINRKKAARTLRPRGIDLATSRIVRTDLRAYQLGYRH